MTLLRPLLLAAVAINTWATEPTPTPARGITVTQSEAITRLARVSAGMEASLRWSQQGYGRFGLMPGNAPWCVDFLQDLLNLENVKAIYEPAHIERTASGTRLREPIVNPAPEQAWRLINGERYLASAGVPVAWRDKRFLLVVRARCERDDRRARPDECYGVTQQTFVNPLEATPPLLCSTASVASEYADGPEWRNRLTVLELAEPRGVDRAGPGRPIRLHVVRKATESAGGVTLPLRSSHAQDIRP